MDALLPGATSPEKMHQQIMSLLKYLLVFYSHMAEDIPKILTSVVASCISVLVKRGIYNPFSEYKKGCKLVVENYFDNIAPCAFKGCLYNKRGHAKGHRDSLGRITRGDFESGESEFWASVDCKLMKRVHNPNVNILNRHRYTLRKYQSFWSETYDNKTCFACLYCSPNHILPCGHGLCDYCVTELSLPKQLVDDPYVFEIEKCIFCGSSDTTLPSSWPWSIRIKPPTAGLRALGFDGGSVRGVIEFEILKYLEGHLGLQLQVGELFDLIIGSSAGQ
ncbi:MAG: hypothetical protein M1834_008187 [Cirrosporium novae-zelandiae]|nr:MAG: hypothetical protein M1834_008187 [Cirrosporium novae-zelandiae]